MISNALERAIVVLAVMVPCLSDAACLNVEREATPGDFEALFICKNSLPAPTYTIVRHYLGDDLVSVFNFDPGGANILCHDYRIGGKSREDCRKLGFRRIDREFETRAASVKIRSLRAFGLDELNALYSSNTWFAFPKKAAFVPDEKCFVHVSRKREVLVGYEPQELGPLADCLVRFEAFLREEKAFLLGKR